MITVLISRESFFYQLCSSYLTSIRAVHPLTTLLNSDLKWSQFVQLSTSTSAGSSSASASSPWFKTDAKEVLVLVLFVFMSFTSSEPSPKIEVRIGVENMVMMVNKTATPAVIENID